MLEENPNEEPGGEQAKAAAPFSNEAPGKERALDAAPLPRGSLGDKQTLGDAGQPSARKHGARARKHGAQPGSSFCWNWVFVPNAKPTKCALSSVGLALGTKTQFQHIWGVF